MADTTDETPAAPRRRDSLARVAASLLAALLPGTALAELAEGDAAFCVLPSESCQLDGTG